MNPSRLQVALLLGSLAIVGPACVVKQQYASPRLDDDVDELMQDLDVLPPFPEPAPASGSLWTDGGPGAALLRDPRAFRINDLVTVVLEERDLGQNESNTDLARTSEAAVGANVAFGLEDTNPQPGEFHLNPALESSLSTQFTGEGTTSRANRLSATLTARVVRVLPNGDLVVAGQKTVTVNRERQVLTLVGSVRPLDIGRTNRVTSEEVGELTVRLWGRGEVDDTVRQGWFMRVMNRLWPF